MGWSRVDVRRPGLLPDDAGQRFYFVHSYAMVCDDERDVVATTTYGAPFVSAVQHANVAGVQFHPEKSHRFGMEVLRRFTRTAADRAPAC
jgi:glutamine amidotransferase